MKSEKPFPKKPITFLSFLVASFLLLHSIQAASSCGLPVIPQFYNSTFSDITDNQVSVASEQLDAWSALGWQNLQDQMARLGAAPNITDLLIAEADIVDYQLYLPLQSTNSDEYVRYGFGVQEELIGVDFSNPLSFLQCFIDFGDFENALLHARVGLANSEAFADVNNFYESNDCLLNQAANNFTLLSKDLQNVDTSNPASLDQIKREMGDYGQAVDNLLKQAHHYKKLELKDAVNIAALTPEEQQLWEHFQSVLTKKYKTAFERAFDQLPNSEGVTDAKQLQNNLEKTQEINASVGAFKLLEQGCLYGFLNVLLTKRNDTDSSLNSFHQLQGRLDQFLNNVDVSNPVAALQAQVDMLAYEKEVASLAVALKSIAVIE